MNEKLGKDLSDILKGFNPMPEDKKSTSNVILSIAKSISVIGALLSVVLLLILIPLAEIRLILYLLGF